VALRAVGLVFAVAVAALSIGCSLESAPSDGSDQMHGGAPAADADVSAVSPPAEEDSMLHVSDVTVTGTEVAVMTTSKGVVRLEFFADDAPNTVASFIELADAGYYDGIKFHRVIAGFVAQGGDPQTRDLTQDEVVEIVGLQDQGIYQPGDPRLGTGGPGWMMKAEFNERPHETGALAMARSASPDSAGSQFYICLAPQPQLDRKYTVFGRVLEGMDVVATLAVGDVIESVVIER
jgi:peptidyl-prolyl cis-trans isomerase B (cyclophilin B)